MSDDLISVPDSIIENSILLVRGHKVILDKELARLYGVSTKVLNQAVKRNLNRFPEDFMFQLTMEEANAWHQSNAVGSGVTKCDLEAGKFKVTKCDLKKIPRKTHKIPSLRFH